MLLCSAIVIIWEDSTNVGSGLGPELYDPVITSELKLICTTIKILQVLDVNIMFINEGIEMNAVVFDYLLNTVVSTAIIIQCAHQMNRSAYIEPHINVGA